MLDNNLPLVEPWAFALRMRSVPRVVCAMPTPEVWRPPVAPMEGHQSFNAMCLVAASKGFVDGFHSTLRYAAYGRIPCGLVMPLAMCDSHVSSHGCNLFIKVSQNDSAATDDYSGQVNVTSRTTHLLRWQHCWRCLSKIGLCSKKGAA